MPSSSSSSPNPSTMLKPEVGPDSLPGEAPVIAYTEKIIEEEQLQLRKYIEENYSKIRDVEIKLANLTLKKIEMSTERIRVARLKEEEAQKSLGVLEAATKVVKDEEEIKQKCEDLNHLVQESRTLSFLELRN
ncbi:hypothetical protein NC651_029280 [Populus alba x Populus x berolinensis]|nr:hypothetical protein NC651_029280 [Populus alba x Populus x berolinensis]